jgi:hypothetical protein
LLSFRSRVIRYFRFLQTNAVNECGVLEEEYSRHRSRKSAISLSVVLKTERERRDVGVPEMPCGGKWGKGTGFFGLHCADWPP